MKIVGDVVVVNRSAHLKGYGAGSKLGKACKCVLQVRNRSNGKQVLVLSTRKEIGAHEYDVSAIQMLRTKFVQEGLATIEIRQPPMNIMLRNCNPGELGQLMEHLEDLRLGKVTTPATPGSSGSSRSQNPNSSVKKVKLEQEPDAKVSGVEEKEGEKPGSLRKKLGAFKRPGSPELSKLEKKKLKKCLMEDDKRITIKSRANYPSEFSSKVEEIKVIGIDLKKIDLRWLRLKCLTILELNGNLVKNIDVLAHLPCSLRRLNLSSNKIELIKEDLFSHAALRSIIHLDLSGNILEKLPGSISELRSLNYANFSGNKLTFLPYNLMDLRNLRILDVSQNSLSFIPATITRLQLDRLDMSNNPNLTRGRVHERGGFYFDNLRIDYVGYSEFPSLFETVCVKTMNLLRKGQNPIPPDLPDIVNRYLSAGKYCHDCGKLALKYKICQTTARPSAFCVGTMSSCVVSPADPCIIKEILCYDCDKRNYMPRIIIRRVQPLARQLVPLVF